MEERVDSEEGLAPRIRAYGLARDPVLTQSELARRLKVSQQTVSNWERAECTPRPGRLRKLAEALGVSIAQLSAPRRQ